jgi:hypothetical protein
MNRVPLLDVPRLKRGNGRSFRVQNLLGTSSKTEKGEALGWHTAIMYLAPYLQCRDVVLGNGAPILDAVAERFGWEVPTLLKQTNRTVCAFAKGEG